MARKESQRALTCQRGGFRLVEATVVAAEAMLRIRVEVHLDLRMSLTDFLDVVERNVFVMLGEMQQHRRMQRLVGMTGDLRTVIADRADHAVQTSCSQIGQRAAPAIA